MNETCRPLARALRARGLSVQAICENATVNPQHFYNVLAGRRVGRRTWLRIAPFLQEPERKIVTEIFGDVLEKPIKTTTHATAEPAAAAIQD